MSFNTASSFITNTNWQFYGGETTMSYFCQMAGLAVQNFVSAAVGIAVLVALIRGIVARHGNGTLGNFYKDMTRIILYILVPLSIVATVVLVSQGVLQTLGGSGRRHRPRPGRLPRGDQAARHQRRRLLQRQLGLSVREPDGVLELRRDVPHPADPGVAAVHVRPDGRQPPPGLDDLRRDVLRCLSSASWSSTLAEQHGTPASTAGRRPSVGAQHRGQGAALRHRVLVAVHGDHHRGLLRRGQHRLRVAHRPRRPGPDGQPRLLRVGLRRRRHRLVHDAAVRPARRVHRRADGRAHAGVPGQEDRAQGHQAGLDRRVVHRR